jgi:RNA 2',3'-cyclic 3'-phosphodiesterase
MRLFVAVHPPRDVLDLVADLPRPDRSGVRWTTRDQWHVTLRFLGEVPSPDPVAAALARAVEPLAPVEAVLGPAVTALGPEVVCIPVAGLGDLAAAVAAATAPFGQPPPERRFRGHLTVARLRRRSGPARPLTGAPIAASWTVTAADLVRSHLGSAGARYEVLATAPLGGAPAGA